MVICFVFMDLKEIKDKEKWNQFLKTVSPNRFSQSWEWGEFSRQRGFSIRRWGIKRGEELLALISLEEHVLGAGKKYWYAPAGPVFKRELPQKDKIKFLQLIKDKGQKENIIFSRLESGEDCLDLEFNFKETINIQPQKSLLLDLRKREEEILALMHQKTRYNIRLAFKKGVKIRKGGLDDFPAWWEIMKKTGDRDKFRLHDREHYKKMIEFFKENPGDLELKFYLAEYKGEIIAGNIVSFFGDTATYLHGASSHQYRKLMAPYALQWQAIREAKEKGCVFYDFYGIDEEKWPGITRFKKGFGGEEVDRGGTRDFIFNRTWYNIYKILREIRRKF